MTSNASKKASGKRMCVDVHTDEHVPAPIINSVHSFSFPRESVGVPERGKNVVLKRGSGDWGQQYLYQNNGIDGVE